MTRRARAIRTYRPTALPLVNKTRALSELRLLRRAPRAGYLLGGRFSMFGTGRRDGSPRITICVRTPTNAWRTRGIGEINSRRLEKPTAAERLPFVYNARDELTGKTFFETIVRTVIETDIHVDDRREICTYPIGPDRCNRGAIQNRRLLQIYTYENWKNGYKISCFRSDRSPFYARVYRSRTMSAQTRQIYANIFDGDGRNERTGGRRRDIICNTISRRRRRRRMNAFTVDREETDREHA